MSCFLFFFSSRRRHTRCALVTGVQTCALPISRQKIRGVDLSGSYRVDVGPGSTTLRGSASWLDSTQQSTDLQAPFDLAGTLNNPPRFHGCAGAVWNGGAFSASMYKEIGRAHV